MAHRFGSKKLYEDLLRGGISPRRINRLLTELSDHYEELTGEYVRQGLSLTEAQFAAKKRLGSEKEIAEGFLERPALRSWAARWPWLFYIFVPVCCLVFAVVIVTSLTVMGVLLGQWLGHFDSGTVIERSGQYLLYAAPVLLAAAVCWFAVVRRSRFLWPLLGVFSVAYFGGSFDLAIGWAANGAAESVSVNSTFIYPFPSSWLATLARGTCTLLVVYLFYAYLRSTYLQSNGTNDVESST